MSDNSVELKQGDLVHIENNSIFDMMGHHAVTGKVILVRQNGFSFSCAETGSIETVDFGDGEISVS